MNSQARELRAHCYQNCWDVPAHSPGRTELKCGPQCATMPPGASGSAGLDQKSTRPHTHGAIKDLHTISGKSHCHQLFQSQITSKANMMNGMNLVVLFWKSQQLNTIYAHKFMIHGLVTSRRSCSLLNDNDTDTIKCW